MFNLWKKIPEQIRRLFSLLLILIAAFIYARSALVPKDFGKIGHFRASAIDEIVSQEIQFAGRIICNDCHDDIVEIKSKGYHRNLSCEVCHGPAAKHVNDPSEFMLSAPRERGQCPLCHEYLPSRPTGFPQIVSASHNPMKPCITCHKPHDPVPPETPKECQACHAEIARTKSLSHHVFVECTFCHKTPKEHKILPRQYIPDKPNSREFCGQCHSEDTNSSIEAPNIDISSHGEGYVCWQCHYPHLPEAK